MSRPTASIRSGFTVIELLFMIALIAALASLAVASLTPLLGDLERDSLSDKLRKAVKEARYQAAAAKTTVRLLWDEEGAAFVVELADGGTEFARIETPYPPNDRSVAVAFYAFPAGEGMPRGRTAARRSDFREAPFVLFGPDSSAMNFEAELDYEGETYRHRFDPFSSAEIADET